MYTERLEQALLEEIDSSFGILKTSQVGLPNAPLRYPTSAE